MQACVCTETLIRCCWGLLGTVHHVIILNGKTEKVGPQNMLFCNYIFKLTLSLYHFQNWITSDVRHKGGQVPAIHQQHSGAEAPITVTKTNWLLLYIERVAIYCENHTQHINTVFACGHVRVCARARARVCVCVCVCVCVWKLHFPNANTGSVYSNQYAFKG